MRISGLGCYVVDSVYQNIDFSSEKARQYVSKNGKDGLILGEAALLDRLEACFKKPIETILSDITGSKEGHKSLGGVSIITLISAAQLLFNHRDVAVHFYANIASTEIGDMIMDAIEQTPLCIDHVNRVGGDSVLTYALCGDDGHGQPSRSFICYPSTHPSTALRTEQLDEDFYCSDITVFSCIQWEPEISKEFSQVLEKCKEAKSLTVVNTASDPCMRERDKWVLGDSDEVYQYIDLIIMDQLEAMHYSGANDLASAISFFKAFPIQGILITNGTNPTYVYGRGDLFSSCEEFLPVVADIDKDKQNGLLPTGDTVGCGDNFAGGVVASIAMQTRQKRRELDLVQAAILGSLSGGITSCITGGFFKEEFFGEKMQLVDRYYENYLRQLGRLQDQSNLG